MGSRIEDMKDLAVLPQQNGIRPDVIADEQSLCRISIAASKKTANADFSTFVDLILP
jgi:hypothetical protein